MGPSGRTHMSEPMSRLIKRKRYTTPGAWGVPNASERGRNQKWPNKWARWLHNPWRLGDSQRFKVGENIRSRQQVGRLAT